MTPPPSLSGIHHLTFPVTDIDGSADWFARVLGAQRVSHLDHKNSAGKVFGAVLRFPGVDILMELLLIDKLPEWKPDYDPVTFGVANRTALAEWVLFLDDAGIEHSPVTEGHTGFYVSIRSPDDIMVRLYVLPDHGFEKVTIK